MLLLAFHRPFVLSSGVRSRERKIGHIRRRVERTTNCGAEPGIELQKGALFGRILLRSTFPSVVPSRGAGLLGQANSGQIERVSTFHRPINTPSDTASPLLNLRAARLSHGVCSCASEAPATLLFPAAAVDGLVVLGRPEGTADDQVGHS